MTQTFGVLAADKIAKPGLDWIEAQDDATLINRPDFGDKETGGSLEERQKACGELLSKGGIHAMMVRSGIKINKEVLENPGDLKVIARAGVGVDNIDLDAATAKGILVVNTAEASTITTAEHAFTLMCALARNIGPAYKSMTEGRWDRKKLEGVQLAGKTLGIVGFGRIGQTLAKRALAFDMEVMAFDPFINSATMMDGKVKMFTDFLEMLPNLDIVSFHVPLNDQTRGMLNAKAYEIAKPGLMVVNAARGGVVDEDDIVPAIEAGKCGGAALDVFASEPLAEDSPLRSHPKVLCTPHLGASTKEAQLAVSTDAGLACMTYLRGEGIKGAVNAGGFRVDLTPTQKSFVELASRMSHLLSPMITRGIASVNIEIKGSQLSAASGTIERTALIGLMQSHIDEALNVINVGNIATQRGISSQISIIEDKDGTAALANDAMQLTIEVKGPPEAVDADTPEVDKTRRIVGRVYEDGKPRVIEVNRYHMDMVPEGNMVLIQNDDQPGMIGLVGQTFGTAGVNIADMAISRRGDTALMLLKIDGAAPESLSKTLLEQKGILKVAEVNLS